MITVCNYRTRVEASSFCKENLNSWQWPGVENRKLQMRNKAQIIKHVGFSESVYFDGFYSTGNFKVNWSFVEQMLLNQLS